MVVAAAIRRNSGRRVVRRATLNARSSSRVVPLPPMTGDMKPGIGVAAVVMMLIGCSGGLSGSPRVVPGDTDGAAGDGSAGGVTVDGGAVEIDAVRASDGHPAPDATTAISPDTAASPGPDEDPVAVDDRTGDSSVVYGDSIAAAVNPGWTSPVGVAYVPGRFLVDAAGGRNLEVDIAKIGAPALAAEIYAFVSSATKRRLILLFIGTNDFAAATGSAAAFGSQYGQLLDAIHALDVSAETICITPLFRADQGNPNSKGDALAAYRSAIGAAQSTRPWAVFADSSSWLGAGDFVEGVHPNAAGYSKIVTKVRALMGF